MNPVSLFTILLIIITVNAFEYDYTMSEENLFNTFIQKENIVFQNDYERTYRFGVFKENLERINTLNAKYHPKTTFGLNQFGLLSTEEFKEQYLLKNEIVAPVNAPVAREYTEEELRAVPETFDWRKQTPPVVTPVKNQGQCGSCWAFSTTGNIEGQWALSGQKLVSLSEQQLVDCDHHCMKYENQQACDAGCEGGLPPNAYEYVIGFGGINSDETYPYEGVDAQCRADANKNVANITKWNMVSQDEEQMKAYLANNGPLSVAVDAIAWQFYVAGVFYLPCGTSLDHAVLAVGYDTETDIFGRTMPYWIIKNSWSSSWGYDGYIYLERGNGRCGVNLFASSSIV